MSCISVWNCDQLVANLPRNWELVTKNSRLVSSRQLKKSAAAVLWFEDFPFLFKVDLCFILPTSHDSYLSVLKCLVFRTVEWLFYWPSSCISVYTVKEKEKFLATKLCHLVCIKKLILDPVYVYIKMCSTGAHPGAHHNHQLSLMRNIQSIIAKNKQTKDHKNIQNYTY